MSVHHHHAGHDDHGHEADPAKKDFSKRVAVLISVLAALLAVVEMGGKNAQNTALISNQDAANFWNFFQAKTIRMTTLRTAAEQSEVEGTLASPAEAEKRAQQVAKWKATAQRYNDEPDTGEGRKQLASRAKAAEKKRDHALAAYHNFEFGSAAFQLAIVLASASVVTGVMALAFIAGGLGVLGTVLALLGWFAPMLLHL